MFAGHVQRQTHLAGQGVILELMRGHDAPPARRVALKLGSFRGHLGRGCRYRGAAPDNARQGCCRGGFLLYCPCSFLLRQVKGPRQRARTALQVAFLGEYPKLRCEPNSITVRRRWMPRPPGETLGAFVRLVRQRLTPTASTGSNRAGIAPAICGCETRSQAALEALADRIRSI